MFGRTVTCLTRTAWILLAAACCPLYGDQEASNIPHVQAAKYGQCYAKSVPAELYGSKGTTNVFRVGRGRDVPLSTYDWFSQQIYLSCNVSDDRTPVGVSVVRLGPWPRGHAASADHLAIAFYFKGGELRKYSTLDIAGKPDNVSPSVSHYTVIEQVLGYRRLRGNQYAFEVETTDGRLLSFDPATGAIIR